MLLITGDAIGTPYHILSFSKSETVLKKTSLLKTKIYATQIIVHRHQGNYKLAQPEKHRSTVLM